MNASVPAKALVGLWLVALLAGCASREPKRLPSPAPPANRVGSLAITNGIKVLGSTGLPPGFIPDLAYGPLWLEGGKLVAVAGSVNGQSVLIGFSGPGLATQRLIAADHGAGAPRAVIRGAAASPDATMLALVVSSSRQDKVVVLTGSGEGDWRTVAAIPGTYAGAQLKWLNASTLVIALRGQIPTTNPIGASKGGPIVIVKLGDPGTVQGLTKIRCDLSSLHFSPDGRWAVGQGDANTPPVLLDLDNQVCSRLDRYDPIRVVSWRPDGLAFLYAAPGPMGVPAIFRYDHAGGASSVVAIASGAAAYAADGTIIAIGNEQLTWRSARAGPSRPVTAQIALFPPGQTEITVNSLGFETTPELLARASMIFASPSNNGLIDIAIVKTAQPLRELIEYSYPTRAAFALAGMAPASVVAASWSPDNTMIALIDGSAQPPRLTVIAPPR